MTFKLFQGDCVELMARAKAGSVDAIVCDPPYELGFMGKSWDGTGVAYDARTWRAALRVLKPGGHLLAFGGTRTFFRLGVAIEDAGFEVRDCLMWLYGQGFPKSMDVSKAIDKAAGAKREKVGDKSGPVGSGLGNVGHELPRGTFDVTAPATDAARQWDGWGTALKPAWEPIIMARKPFEGTVAENVQRYGTGALNIEGCRVPLEGESWQGKETKDNGSVAYGGALNERSSDSHPDGRWPANLILDEEAAARLDAEVGSLSGGKPRKGVPGGHTFGGKVNDHNQSGEGFWPGGEGGPSRFFYVAKASRTEREAGLAGVVSCAKCGGLDSDTHPPESGSYKVAIGEYARDNPKGRPVKCRRNDHPTVKPVSLMRWLVRLVTPPEGLVLDPFNGSGTTGVAAVKEGFRYTGLDLDEHYLDIARARIMQVGGEDVSI